jgi:hypothetical protein
MNGSPGLDQVAANTGCPKRKELGIGPAGDDDIIRAVDETNMNHHLP